MRRRMSAFEFYLRTGWRAPDEPELVETKFNPWHDPDDGRFTFAGQRRRFGGGRLGSGELNSGQGRVAPRARVPIAAARPALKPARPGPNQDSATYLRNSMDALERIQRETRIARSAPTISGELVQKFKQRMIPDEGDRNDVYPDNRGFPTVGIGHKVVPEDKLKMGDRISNARKEDFWRQDSAKALRAAQQQADEAGIRDADFLIALAGVNFQLGREWRNDFKKTWALMLAGDYGAAAREVKDSKWFRQTPNRVESFRKALLALPNKRTPDGRQDRSDSQS